MKQIGLLLSLFLVLSIVLKGVELKEIRTIGNEEDDYIFFRINGAVLSKNHDIYIVDSKGDFISRYNWSGKFIKKIGRSGSGPGDLNHPSYLDLYKDKLYTYDRRNFRIAKTDLQLNSIKYHKIYDATLFGSDFFALDAHTFIGPAFDMRKGCEENKIKIINFKTSQSTSFFDHDPIKPSIGEKASKYYSVSKLFRFSACLAVDRDANQVLTSFSNPDNPLVFYLYSMDGKCLDSFSHKIEAKYRFCRGSFKEPYNPPKTSFVPIILDLFIHEDMYVVFLLKVEYSKRLPVNKENVCLIFDRKSKALKHEFQVVKDFRPFFISDDDYLLGTKSDDDIQKLYIYKLEL